MHDSHDTDQRLTNLEIKASFTEDLLDQLNQVIVRQQEQIDALVRRIERLRGSTLQDGSGAARNSRDELPPHY